MKKIVQMAANPIPGIWALNDWVRANTPAKLKKAGNEIEKAITFDDFPPEALKSPSNVLCRAILVKNAAFKKAQKG